VGLLTVLQTIIEASVLGEIAYVTILGRIVRGRESADALHEAIRRCTAPNIRELVLDMQGVNKVDAAGLGVLASAYCATQSIGSRLVLANTPPLVQELLALTRLDKTFPSAKSPLRRSQNERPNPQA
jgi:anti-anti-sigma factor